MSINKISVEERKKLLDKSVVSLPDNPSQRGVTAEAIKKKFVEYVLGKDENDTESIVGLVNRIVDETNEALGSAGGGGSLFLHIIETEYVFSEPKSVYEGARVPLKLHYLSTSNTPYSMGTYLSTIPNFFKQQIGKVYYAQDDMDLRNWQVMFDEIATGNESSVTALNSRGEIQFGDNLLDSPVLSDTVVAIE